MTYYLLEATLNDCIRDFFNNWWWAFDVNIVRCFLEYL